MRRIEEEWRSACIDWSKETAFAISTKDIQLVHATNQRACLHFFYPWSALASYVLLHEPVA